MFQDGFDKKLASHEHPNNATESTTKPLKTQRKGRARPLPSRDNVMSDHLPLWADPNPWGLASGPLGGGGPAR